MTLTTFNSYSAIWFDENNYGLVMSRSINGESICSRGNKQVYETNLEVLFGACGVLSEKEIVANVAKLGTNYRNTLDVKCNNHLMSNAIKKQLDTHLRSFIEVSYMEYNTPIEIIVRAKTLLNDQRIKIVDGLKAEFQKQLDEYHSTDNQTPLISALLMCMLQVKELI